MSTSFFQYLYCTLCKVSHKQRKKKHTYSQRHQITLKNVLSKFSKKVEQAKSSMDQPAVHALGWETGAKVWCYLCQTDINRHQTRDDCTVANAAFLAHLARPEHSKKMHEFFWDNLVPVNKKKTFVVSSEEINRFMENAEQAVADYQKKEKEKLEQEVYRIRTAGQRSQMVVWMGKQQQLVKTSSSSSSSSLSRAVKAGSVSSATTSQYDPHGSDIPPQGKKTVFAFGHGLTCIATPSQSTEESHGNIYTGAVPPWMMEEEDAGKGEIGPTAETFNKHLQGLRKQKLPACRVGATFNHKVDTTSQWLPAFGRVWNSGRRLNSQHQFLKERSSKGSSLHGQNQKNAKSTSSYKPPPPSATISRPEDARDDTTQLLNTCHDSWSSQGTFIGNDVAEVVDGNSGQYAAHASHQSVVSDPGGYKVVSHPGPGPHVHTHNTHMFHSVSGSYDSCSHSHSARSETSTSSQQHQASSASAPFPCNVSPFPDRTTPQTYTESNSQGYRTPVDVGSSETEMGVGMSDSCRPYKRRNVVQSPQVSDADLFEDCRPYKWQRGMQNSQTWSASDLIPITPSLLSPSVTRTQHAKKS